MRVEMRALLLSSCALALAACSSVSDMVGQGKDAPDEFAIVTKQPLVIPPDFYLHPPKPGAAPTNQLSATDTAQSELFSDDPAQIASTISGDYSDGEKILLARAGAAGATDSIRQLIAADNRSLEASDTDFTSTLLFGSSGGDAGHPLNADAEKARLDAAGPGRPVAEAAPMPAQSMAPSYPAYGGTGGALPPIGGAPQSAAPVATQAPAPMSAPPPRTASTYAPPVAGSLPDLSGQQPPAPAQKPRSSKKSTKDDSGWLDGIF